MHRLQVRSVVAPVVAAWAACGGAWGVETLAGEQSRPNVVLILLDNVGQEWFGCYGSEEGCTPRIDALATAGVRVENCYAPPVCGPSRTALLTGRYPHTTGFRLHHDAALYGGGGLQPDRDVVFPRLFRDAGYRTAIAGKWQINNLYDEPGILGRHGFDASLVWPGSIDRDLVDAAGRETFRDIVGREDHEAATAFNRNIESRYWNPVFVRDGVRERMPGAFGPDVARDFAVRFLRENSRRPFLLYLPMVLTHGQSFTEHVVATPRNRDTSRPRREMFADMLRHADGIVGAIVDELDSLGLRGNTIVVVASDNGTERAITARRGGRLVQGGLYELTEPGGNVPLVFSAPGLIAGGRVLPLADFTDVFPTLCDLAAVPLRESYRPDGVSLAPWLRDPGARPPRDWILNEYHTTRVVRDGRYKLYGDGRFFDLEADPDETRDLSGVDDARAAVPRRRLRQVLDGLPDDVPPPFRLLSLSAFKIRQER